MRPQGVYAAVLVPRLSGGAVNERGFRGILEFLPGKKISRIVVNGATGEYCLTTPRDLARLLAICNEALTGNAELLCGIGAPALPGHALRSQVIRQLPPIRARVSSSGASAAEAPSRRASTRALPPRNWIALGLSRASFSR